MLHLLPPYDSKIGLQVDLEECKCFLCFDSKLYAHSLALFRWIRQRMEKCKAVHNLGLLERQHRIPMSTTTMCHQIPIRGRCTSKSRQYIISSWSSKPSGWLDKSLSPTLTKAFINSNYKTLYRTSKWNICRVTGQYGRAADRPKLTCPFIK